MRPGTPNVIAALLLMILLAATIQLVALAR